MQEKSRCSRFDLVSPQASRVVSITFLALVTLTLTPVAFAIPISDELPFTKDVFCDIEKCGTMKINKYEVTAKEDLNRPSNRWVGGVLIDGKFELVKPVTYHYLQAVKTESDTFRWINDASVPYPQPFLDIPPGGHKVRTTAGGGTFSNQVFDYLPWYDPAGRRFPGFLDTPKDFLLLAKTQGDKKLEWAFETWLICVIEDKHDNDRQAKDDTYKIAPLLGWKWGYDIIYEDIRRIGIDDPDDFTVTKKSFAFTMTPSADWTNALNVKYGDPAKPANQDFWNITTGNCKECVHRTVPEPSTLLLLGSGLAWLGSITQRRRRRTRAT